MTLRQQLIADGGRQSKVARVIDEYGLEGVGRELAETWVGENGAAKSLRTLADEFNRRILSVSMRRANVDVLEGEVANTYRLLTDDDVSAGTETRTRRRLERAGIDVDHLQRSFVSHQAIHTYLTKYRGVQKPTSDPEDRLEKAQDTIRKLRSRTVAVTRDTVERLQRTGQLDSGEFEVLVDISVVFPDSGEQYDVGALLDPSDRPEPVIGE